MLLQEINRGLPAALACEYDALVTRRRDGTLAPAEQERLIQLTDEVEALEARRVACMTELVRLRNTSPRRSPRRSASLPRRPSMAMTERRWFSF